MAEAEGSRCCTSCGAQANTGDLYCIRCGTPLHGAQGAVQPPAPASTGPKPGAVGTQEPVEVLHWRKAFIWSAKIVGTYVALFYVLGVVFPESFGLGDNSQVTGFLINAVIFFFVFTVVYALGERARRRSRALDNRRNIEGKLITLPADRKISPVVAAVTGLLILVAAIALLKPDVIWGSAYEVVYEKDMSAMMVSMSGYDYVDNNGVAYIKVEVEDPDDIGPVYEDLAARPKADEYDCVVVDFFVQGDRSGGIADGRIIENRPSCSEDVEFFEQNVSSFDYASETDDVFNDNGVKGVKNPEEW